MNALRVKCVFRHYSSFSNNGIKKLERKNLSQILDETERLLKYDLKLSFGWILDKNLLVLLPQAKKIASVGHPAQKLMMQLALREDRSLNTLFMLLLSKSCGFKNIKSEREVDLTTGVLDKQLKLIEISEILRATILMHQNVVNFKSSDSDATIKYYGNILSVLGGDYLLSVCYSRLASLANHELNALISSALLDSSEGTFFGVRGDQNYSLPSKQITTSKLPPDFTTESLRKQNNILGNAEHEWTLKKLYTGASLTAKTCEGLLLLAGHDKNTQKLGYEFGKHVTLAWEALQERKAITNKNLESFGLSSAPVLFHLLHEPKLYDKIESGINDTNKINLEVIREAVLKGPALEHTKNLQNRHLEMARKSLKKITTENINEKLYDIFDYIQEN